MPNTILTLFLGDCIIILKSLIFQFLLNIINETSYIYLLIYKKKGIEKENLSILDVIFIFSSFFLLFFFFLLITFIRLK